MSGASGESALRGARGVLQSARLRSSPRVVSMLAAYQQLLDPLRDSFGWSRIFSTLFAALPVLVLFWLLVPRRWPAPRAAAAGALTALAGAVVVYGMPTLMAVMAFCHGAAFGLMPVGWTIFNAMLLYNVTVETGQFTIVR